MFVFETIPRKLGFSAGVKPLSRFFGSALFHEWFGSLFRYLFLDRLFMVSFCAFALVKFLYFSCLLQGLMCALAQFELLLGSQVRALGGFVVHRWSVALESVIGQVGGQDDAV